MLQERGVGAAMSSSLYATARLYHYGTVLPAHYAGAGTVLPAACALMMALVLVLLCVARGACVVATLASFRDLAQLPDAPHTRLYFAQLAQNFRDAISCVGVRVRRNNAKQQTAKLI